MKIVINLVSTQTKLQLIIFEIGLNSSTWPPPNTNCKQYGVGFPRLTTRFSWLFLVSKSFTTYLDMKKSHPRQTDCPGSFHSRQSSGTAFRIHPYYDEHFTQTSSPQTRLFSVCNPICSVFKVLPILGFCFTTDVQILASHSYALDWLYNAWNPCYIKIR